jgi:hypothetical protein
MANAPIKPNILSVVMLNVIILNAVVLSDIILNAVMLSVEASLTKFRAVYNQVDTKLG